MGWFTRKLDSLIGAVFAGAGGAAASQFDAFVLQYLQRLGGHLDEARQHYTQIAEADQYRNLTTEVRAALVADAQNRMDQLSLAYRSLADADLLHLPWVFVQHVDSEIATRTLEIFRPVLPIDMPGLIYAGCGAVLGLIVYELIKLPFAMLLPRHRYPSYR